jgi:hypothetical protein
MGAPLRGTGPRHRQEQSCAARGDVTGDLGAIANFCNGDVGADVIGLAFGLERRGLFDQVLLQGLALLTGPCQGQINWSPHRLSLNVTVTFVTSAAMLPTGELQGGGWWGRVNMAAKASLVAAIGDRYRTSIRAERTRVLDEFVAVTGYHRKHTILCRGPHALTSTHKW